jgi:phage-related tail protein
VADGLNPVTQRLTQLDQTFQSLEHAAAAIRDLAAARKDIEHLTHALAQSATIAEAIANLPEQIRSILERAAPERTGIAAWFHRPKGL